MANYVIALDQGTTSSRAIIFDKNGIIVSSAQYPFKQIYPQPGWVEHNPKDILSTTVRSLGEALSNSKLKPEDIVGIGVTNQRETTVIWDKTTGEPVYNAIVWQCRRTAEVCDNLKKDNIEGMIKEKTGLIIDAYFSGTKIKWIMDNVEGVRKKALNGELLFGNIDTWLIWNLTGAHTSDYSNCSRTMLFNIDTLMWDSDLLKLLDIPECVMPKPVSSCEEYGRIKSDIPELQELAGIPICGSIGDQPSALFGQGCIKAGEAKNTYGTGCFTLMNTGDNSVRSASGLLTSVAWSINGQKNYAVEGSVFNAGSSIQWLKDGIGIIDHPAEADSLAASVNNNNGVYFVSAFTGLGAPWWDMYARGTMVGITRGTTKAHICRAVLEGIAYQVKDLLVAMEKDSETSLTSLKVDGGASVNNFLMQFQSDLLGIKIDRPVMVETTAFGAAFMAGLAAGLWNSPEEIRSIRQTDRIFSPQMSPDDIGKYYKEWKRAVERSGNWIQN